LSAANVREIKVLIVEDNLHFRTLVRTILQAIGVQEIEEARDGAEAMEVLRHFAADLAILDWKMDGVDGIECIRRIRAEGTSPNPFLPIIMVTGYTEPNLVASAREVGVNDFLAKPISAKSLLSRIVAVLDESRAFIRTGTYFGPDRRRRQVPFKGADRRKAQTHQVPVPGRPCPDK
jgi:CheY-like chemotaxis protein